MRAKERTYIGRAGSASLLELLPQGRVDLRICRRRALCGCRLVVSVSAEDDKSLDAALGDLHRVMLGLTDEAEGMLLLISVAGVRSAALRTSRHLG